MRKGGMGIGILLGLAISVVIGLIFWGGGQQWIDVEHVKAMAAEVDLDKKWVYLCGALYWITVNSILEEYVWRWFVFRKFEVLVGSGAAVVLSAIGFAVHHGFALSVYFDWQVNLLCCLGIGIGGAVWSWLYLRYRSVWPGYASHAIVDVAVFAIGYFLFFGQS